MLGEENKDMKIKLLDQLIEKLMDMDDSEQPDKAGLSLEIESEPKENELGEDEEMGEGLDKKSALSKLKGLGC